MCFIGNTQQLVSTLKYHMGEELLVSGGVTSHTRVQPMLGERLELGVVRAHSFPCHATTSLWTFTFSHLADTFIQSDLQGIQILFTFFILMAHCTSWAFRGSVSCSRALRQGIELATVWLLNDFSTTVPLSPEYSTVRMSERGQEMGADLSEDV